MCAFVLYLQAEERLHKSVLASFFTEFALPSHSLPGSSLHLSELACGVSSNSLIFVFACVISGCFSHVSVTAFLL